MVVRIPLAAVAHHRLPRICRSEPARPGPVRNTGSNADPVWGSGAAPRERPGIDISRPVARRLERSDRRASAIAHTRAQPSTRRAEQRGCAGCAAAPRGIHTEHVRSCGVGRLGQFGCTTSRRRGRPRAGRDQRIGIRHGPCPARVLVVHRLRREAAVHFPSRRRDERLKQDALERRPPCGE